MSFKPQTTATQVLNAFKTLMKQTYGDAHTITGIVITPWYYNSFKRISRVFFASTLIPITGGLLATVMTTSSWAYIGLLALICLLSAGLFQVAALPAPYHKGFNLQNGILYKKGHGHTIKILQDYGFESVQNAIHKAHKASTKAATTQDIARIKMIQEIEGQTPNSIQAQTEAARLELNTLKEEINTRHISVENRKRYIEQLRAERELEAEGILSYTPPPMEKHPGNALATKLREAKVAVFVAVNK